MTFEIDLEGRRALVTGGGQGVGRAISLALSSAGASVAVNDYVAERAEAVAKEITAAGGEAEPVPFDVTDYAAVTSAVAAAGPFDILVNNAGNAGTATFSMRFFHETEPDEWDRYFGVNLHGVLYCSRAVVPGMIERGRGGRIITIVSDAGRWGEPRLVAYSAAKAGAAGFSRALARELGRYQITVNNIALGSIRPGADADDPEVQRSFRGYILRRPGQPEDPAGLVTFLASQHAAWISGQTYPVNGGYTVNQ